MCSYFYRHTNVIAYKEAFYDETSQTLCIVMEFANDGDVLGKVQELLKRGVYMSERQIWQVFIQLALGL